MSKVKEAYPLNWPDGWHRTPPSSRKRAQFHGFDHGTWSDGSPRTSKKALTVDSAMSRVSRELASIGGWTTATVISTNVPVRLDGLPRSKARTPDDPGVAVYWPHGKSQRCMAVDRYDRVADNLAAIAATLEAMRAIERHGGAEILDRAFTGFIALPQPEQWWQVLGVKSDATREQIDEAYRPLAMKHHPDRGGDAGEMARVNTARDQGYEVRA